MFDLPLTIRLQDVLDILLVTFLIYRILLLIKGTRAFQVLLGLILIFVAYVGSQVLELVALNWILNAFLSSFILVVVILFQNDIRRALAHMGRHPLWSSSLSREGVAEAVEELVRASVGLANKKVGAIIVLERETQLKNFVEGGVEMRALLSRELIQTIFMPYSPLHDGAVLVRGNTIAWAATFLPLTTRVDLEKELGTRHRAAMGITEETDAVAIVVSEERGAISVVINGRITRDLDGTALRRVLTNLFPKPGEKPRKAKGKKTRAKEAQR
ncbi:MAG: TIGR00159 family protein [Deltaproteobacteria bacterium]|nr:MAG: TIGR00159 family protein [Deltaproteobacteria bacterium]